MKKTLSLVLIAVLLLSCTSCFNFSMKKVFEKSGMEITLTSDFYEKEHVSYTSVYESNKIAVFTLKEEFALLPGFSKYTVDEYADSVVEMNQIDATVEHEDDLTYFTFDETVNGKDFVYFGFAYKGDDAFWLIQFACEQKNEKDLKDDIFKYAKSVTVD